MALRVEIHRDCFLTTPWTPWTPGVARTEDDTAPLLVRLRLVRRV